MKPTETGSVLISPHFRPQPMTVYNGNLSVRKAQKHSKNAYTAYSCLVLSCVVCDYCWLAVCIVVVFFYMCCYLMCICSTFFLLQTPDCWLEVSIRKVLRPATSTQVFLGFPVSISKC